MRKFYTKSDIQNILESNPLGAEVGYALSNPATGDNYIVFARTAPSDDNLSLWSDDMLHIPKATLQVSHYRLNQADSIAQFMAENFATEPKDFLASTEDSTYLEVQYRFEILTDFDW